jgi:hypothetical protein
MDANTKIYQIDKHKQLIPLNGTMVNFSCFFEVKSRDNKPFQIAIVEQGEIKPKQYKSAENGSINGQFESDGQLKSYFMVLKAQNPCECNVQIIVKPKEPTTQGVQSPPPHYSTLLDDSIEGQADPNQMKGARVEHHQPIVQIKAESYFQLKYILGISVVIVVVYLLYKYRKKFTRDSFAASISNSSF